MSQNTIELIKTAIKEFSKAGFLTPSTYESILKDGNQDVIAIIGDKDTLLQKLCELLNTEENKLILRSEYAEFLTVKDTAGKEITSFQSDAIDSIEESMITLLEYLGIKYEFEMRNRNES